MKCKGFKTNGEPCKSEAVFNGLCVYHIRDNRLKQCEWILSKGNQCKRRTREKYCKTHQREVDLGFF